MFVFDVVIYVQKQIRNIFNKLSIWKLRLQRSLAFYEEIKTGYFRVILFLRIKKFSKDGIQRLITLIILFCDY